MMNDMYYPRRDDDEVMIDIKSLVVHIVTKWRVILIVAIVCAFVGGIIGFIKERQSVSTEALSSDDMIENTAEGLTTAQKDEAEEYYTQLIKYDQMIGDLKSLYDEAFIMNLDPYSAVSCDLFYLLETDIGSVSSIYKDMLNDEDYSKISNALGSYKGKKYLSEMITVSSEGSMDTYNLDLLRMDRLSGEIKNGYKLLFKVVFFAPDRNSSEAIAEIVEAAIKRETENLANHGATIKCTLLNTRTNDTDLAEGIIGLQRDKINYLGTLESNKGNFYNNIIAKVDAREKAYIDSLYAAKAEGKREIVTEKEISWKRVLKYLIVFVVAGGFAVVCLITVVYVTGGKLHAADEIVYGARIPVLQTLKEGSTASFSVFMEEFKKKTEQDIRSVYIAADKSSARALGIARDICEGTDKEVQCYIGGIVPDADDMKQLLISDGVLILPVIESTKTKSILLFTDICLRNKISIIGSVPVITGAKESV